MTWMQARSGRAFDLLQPDPKSVLMADLVRQLAALPRFNGATLEPWSVAQHTLLCEALLPVGAPPELRLAVLMHDLHEAYIGDITSPVERALRALGAGDVLGQLKWRVQAAIDTAFGWHGVPVLGVKAIDELALATEKAMFLAPTAEWPGAPQVTRDDRARARWVPSDPAHVVGLLRVRLRCASAALGLRPLPSLGR